MISHGAAVPCTTRALVGRLASLLTLGLASCAHGGPSAVHQPDLAHAAPHAHATSLAPAVAHPSAHGKEVAGPWSPPGEPTREALGGATCRAGEPVELGTSSVRTLRPRVAFAHPGAGLVAWPTGEDHLAVRALRGAEVGPTVDVELDQAIGLAALGPAGTRGFVAHTMVPICGTGFGQACSRSRGLAPDGTPTGPADEPEPANQWGEVSGAASTSDALVLSRWWRYGGGIDLFRLGASGAVEVEHHRIRIDAVGDVPVRALAADGATVVAYGVEGYDPERPFVLALGGSRQYLRTIPPESEVVRLSVSGTTATVVFRPPRLRPRWLRVSTADGSVVEGPTTMEPGAALPPDLADVVVPSVAVARRRLVLTRRDLAGNTIGEPFELAPASGRPTIATAWSGADLAVLWATRAGRTWRLWLRRVECPSAPR